MKKLIETKAASHHGKRTENQDRLFAEWRRGNPQRALIAVADGMGGHEKGEVAAEIAIAALKKMFATGPFLENNHAHNRNVIQHTIEQANREIYAHSLKGNRPGEMGTTLTGALLVGDGYYVFNIGDSRTYAISQDDIQQLTVDHSADQDALAKGIISQEQVGKTPYANALVRSLGTSEQAQPDIFPAGSHTAYPLDGDMILFCCSDGLWGKVGAAEIRRELAGRKNLPQALKNLLAIAYLNGSSDNISAAALEWGRFPRRKKLSSHYPAIEKLAQGDKKKIHFLKQTAVLFIALFLSLAAGLGYLLKKDYTTPPSRMTVLAGTVPPAQRSAAPEAVARAKSEPRPALEQRADLVVWRKAGEMAHYKIEITDSMQRTVYVSPDLGTVLSFSLKQIAAKFKPQEKYFFILYVSQVIGQPFLPGIDPALPLDTAAWAKSAVVGKQEKPK